MMNTLRMLQAVISFKLRFWILVDWFWFVFFYIPCAAVRPLWSLARFKLMIPRVHKKIPNLFAMSADCASKKIGCVLREFLSLWVPKSVTCLKYDFAFVVDKGQKAVERVFFIESINIRVVLKCAPEISISNSN